MRTWLLLPWLLVLSLLLGACGGAGDGSAEAGGSDGVSAGDAATEDPAAAETATDPAGGGGATETGQATVGAGAGATEEPVRNNPAPAGEDLGAGCERLAVDDHRYTVADAGEVELRGDRRPLQVADVRPASGWQHEIDKADDDDVRITFSSDDGEEYAFEADFTHGGLMVTVCPG